MQDKEYDHSLYLKKDQEKKKKVVEVNDEVSLKVNRSIKSTRALLENKERQNASQIRFVRSVNCGGCSTHYNKTAYKFLSPRFKI